MGQTIGIDSVREEEEGGIMKYTSNAENDNPLVDLTLKNVFTDQEVTILKKISKRVTLLRESSFLSFLMNVNETSNNEQLNKEEKEEKQRIINKIKQCIKPFYESESLSTNYLSTSFENTLDTLNNILELDWELKSILIKQEPTNITILESNDEDIVFTAEEIKKESENEYMKIPNKVKVRFLLLTQRENNVSFRKYCNPVIAKFRVDKSFTDNKQHIHIKPALLIGPWLFELDSITSLCIPKRCYSTAAYLASDIPELSTLANLDEVIPKVSKLIVDCNLSKHYHSHHYNSQIFIENILALMNYEFPKSGAIYDLIQELKLKGDGACEMFFSITHYSETNPFGSFVKSALQSAEKALKVTLKRTQNNAIVFRTHTELDMFVSKLLQVCPNLFEDYHYEWNLLKRFDRIFWLYHFHDTNNEKFKELSSGEDVCPFGNPSRIRTLTTEYW
ncbi:hypothetical protein ABK040_001929 [Willaertia magna]